MLAISGEARDSWEERVPGFLILQSLDLGVIGKRGVEYIEKMFLID
jgi:hypothetical protein